MVGEVAGKKLYDAASKGDAKTFEELVQENPDLLDGVSFACSNRSPLHVATMQGNSEIVEIMLRRNPQLAEELDSQKSSPLHIAAAKGYVRIASRLLTAAKHMCWSRDCHGMNPIHIAAMNGHVEILKTLIEADPFPAREKLGRGETVMHLCVKHRQVPALQFLADNESELVEEGDDNGDTVLHLAARYKQLEIIKYLVESKKIDKKSRNGKGETPLEIILSKSPYPEPDTIPSQIIEILEYKEDIEFNGFFKRSEFLMVVVILIATMAFQAAVSPPGGVWSEDSSLHKAGESVMATNHPEIYKCFVRANTIAFTSSLTVITLLSTNLPSINIFVMMLTSYATWVSVASVAVSYGTSIMMITPSTQITPSFSPVITIVIIVYLVPYGVVAAWIIFSTRLAFLRFAIGFARMSWELLLFHCNIQPANDEIQYRRINIPALRDPINLQL